jgi:uracil phosphoribosyltransferase
MKAVEILKEHGVPEERIIFINLVITSSNRYLTITDALRDLSTRRPESILHQVPYSARGTSLLRFQLHLHFIEYVQITGWIDKGLNEKAYILPGLGDFGDRR